MKKSKIFLTMFFAVLFAVMTPQTVTASEFDEIEVRSNVTIKANVPDGFTEDIAFVLEEEVTQVRFQYLLTAENEYTGNLSLLGNNAFLPQVTFKKGGNYKTDLAEKYMIEGEEVELTFTVTPITYSIENDEEERESLYTEEKELPHGEDIDPQTGLPTAESVIKAYMEKVSFIQDDPKFSSFLATYSSASMKKSYLKADPLNTEEQWESMKEIDRFNYYILYSMPHSYMINSEFASANEMVEKLWAQKDILSQIENGEIVYDAIVEVWKWHYRYWQVTGTFYNFYNYYDGENAGQLTEAERAKLKKNEDEEVEEIRDELMSELSEEEKAEIMGEASSEAVQRKHSSSILWIVVALCVGGAVGIGFYFLKNHGKRSSDK